MSAHHQQIQVPSRDSTTNLQLSSLLGVLATLNGALAVAKSHETGDAEGGKNDGGAQAAYESTLIAVCDRIEKIVADNDRWGVAENDALQQAMTKAYISADRMHKIQAAPHNRYRPVLFRLPDGSWVAILGSLDDIERSIIGRGDYPEQALENFDTLFQGGVPKQMQQWLEAREQSIKQGEEPPSLQEYEQQQKSVDTGGTERTSTDESNPNSAQGNSGSTRKKRKSGGAKTDPPAKD